MGNSHYEFLLNPSQPNAKEHPNPDYPILYPIQHITIDWSQLLAQRPLLLQSVEDMPRYLLKPEVLALLDAEKHPSYRLILDLMWTTGARISEVLLLTPASFVDDGFNYGVILTNLKHHRGRPSHAERAQHPKRYVPIADPRLKDEIQCYVSAHNIQTQQRLFTMVRQTVNRHIHALVERVYGAPRAISTMTFRHSFAIHLLLHALPLPVVSLYLGHQSLQTTEIYTQVLTFDVSHFIQGVDFH